MRTFSSLVLAAALAVMATACGISDPSENNIQDFTATIQPGGGNVHQFSSNSGEYRVKLTAIAPDSNAKLNIYLGQTVNGLCTRILGQEGQIFLNQTYALAAPIQKGQYCIQIFDLGVITQPLTYTIQVSYP